MILQQPSSEYHAQIEPLISLRSNIIVGEFRPSGKTFGIRAPTEGARTPRKHFPGIRALSLAGRAGCRYTVLRCFQRRTRRPPRQTCRGVAQPGRALRSGRRGRRFKSSLPDQNHQGDSSLIGLPLDWSPPETPSIQYQDQPVCAFFRGPEPCAGCLFSIASSASHYSGIAK